MAALSGGRQGQLNPWSGESGSLLPVDSRAADSGLDSQAGHSSFPAQQLPTVFPFLDQKTCCAFGLGPHHHRHCSFTSSLRKGGVRLSSVRFGYDIRDVEMMKLVMIKGRRKGHRIFLACKFKFPPYVNLRTGQCFTHMCINYSFLNVTCWVEIRSWFHEEVEWRKKYFHICFTLTCVNLMDEEIGQNQYFYFG